MSVIDQFTAYYREFDQRPVSDMAGFYDTAVVFSDPVHQVEGLPDVQRYFMSIAENVTSCRFEFTGETLTSTEAWFKWIMHFQHPKLAGGKLLQVKGVTHICFGGADGRIISHEDFYDMGSMLYEHVPVLGGGVRWLKRQLVKGSED